ncbi:hypothetical protein SAMN05443287_11417 [Micromonospora phaseoli]|uniref:Uncharacterized protein n=1 Tax=Micromonospora phaseoli TaxID=1144548 RepID=A0A1H7DGU2_9ACTN|nr:hypothetical protein CLV64_102673 [Micromonospora phaseoli]SEK00926.1 hypothetical protein SAMN05443287_11417 [Micromonospora phaseoli]
MSSEPTSDPSFPIGPTSIRDAGPAVSPPS